MLNWMLWNATTGVTGQEAGTAENDRASSEGSGAENIPSTDKESGKLREYLENHETQMMDSYEETENELQFQVLGPKGPKDYMESVQALQMGQSRIWEETLATWLEFSDPPTAS